MGAPVHFIGKIRPKPTLLALILTTNLISGSSPAAPIILQLIFVRMHKPTNAYSKRTSSDFQFFTGQALACGNSKAQGAADFSAWVRFRAGRSRHSRIAVPRTAELVLVSSVRSC